MELYIVGAGGHGEVVLDVIRAAGKHRVIGFLDSDAAIHGKWVDGVKVLGPPSLADGPFVVAVGDNATRQRITQMLRAKGLEPVSVTHPTAYVSPSARLGPGSLICAGAVVCAHAEVGEGVIINTGAIVEHHNVVGNFVHIAPRTVLTGRVTIEEGAMLGAGVTVIPHIRVGAWSVVGAGSVVTRDVPGRTTVAGVPARPLESDGKHLSPNPQETGDESTK